MKIPRPSVAYEGDERGEFSRERDKAEDNGSLFGPNDDDR
jgi:hypothetical protein